VQPRPRRLVAAEAHLPLQFGGGDPALARGHQVDRQEPLGQTGLGLLEDRALEQRVLLAAARALVNVAPPERVGFVVATRPAAEPLRPTLPEQIVPTLLVAAEPGDERRQVLRQIVRQHANPSRLGHLPPFYRAAIPDQPNLTVMES
jgi:hypothetical protein